MIAREGHRLRKVTIAAALMAAVAAMPHAHAAATETGTQHKILMRADQIIYDTNRSVVTAQGHVEIDYEDRILLADSIAYDQKTDKVTANGHISVLTPDGNVAFAEHVVLTQGLRAGVLDGFKALIGESGKLAAVRAVRTADEVTAATRAVYTPCKICNQSGYRSPTWQVKARHVIYDEKNHRIYYRDAILEMFGVPVFYTPFFSHADPTVKHKSGLLMPEFGSSSTIGSFMRLPFYVALTDSRDLTVAPTFTSDSGEVLQTEYRERWNSGGMWMQLTGAHHPDGLFSGRKRKTFVSLFGSGRTPISGLWHAGYDVQLSSDDLFLKFYDISIEDNFVSDIFIEAVSGRSRFAITGYFFQDLRAGHVRRALTPFVLPSVEYTYIPKRSILGGEFRFDISGAVIKRSTGVDSQRVSAGMRWQKPLVTDGGQLLTFTLDARGDVFHVSNDGLGATDLQGRPLATGSHYISRGQPNLAVDWRWPFISSGRTAGMALVIEPIVQLIAAPYGGNPSGIPNEDSVDFEFDETDVFSLDRVPGHALWESGPRANIGLRTEAFFPKGSVEVLLGQVFRLKPDPIFTPGSGLAEKNSDIVGRYTIKFPPYISLTHRIDLDSGDGSVRRNEVYVDGTYRRSGIELSYVRFNQRAELTGQPREEVNGQATIGFLDHWAAFAAARRNLEAQRMLSTEFGLGWENCCLNMSVSYQRRFTRDRDVPPSTSVILRINFKTGDNSGESSTLFPRRVFSTP